MANPDMLENILRAEGQYPRRDNTLTPNVAWMAKKLKVLAAFGVK